MADRLPGANISELTIFPSFLNISPSPASYTCPPLNHSGGSVDCKGMDFGAHHLVEAFSLLAVLVLSFFFNGLVLILYCMRPSVRTFSNRFVLSLTSSHLMQSVLIIPTTLATIIADSWEFGEVWCQITGCLTICLNLASVLSILLIAIDRNCAVNNPLHYAMTITKKRTGLLIAGVWVLSVVLSVPPLFGATEIVFRREWHTCTILWSSQEFGNLAYGSVLTMFGFVVPLLKVGWIYVAMFKAARRNTERARKNSVSTCVSEVIVNVDTGKGTKLPLRKNSNMSTMSVRKCTPSLSPVNSKYSCFGGDCKAARTGLLVVCSFVICWMPFFSSVVSRPHFKIPEEVCFVISFFTFTACIVNPYVYVFRNKTSRKLLKSLLFCRVGKNRNFLDNRSYTRKIVRSTSPHLVRDIFSSVPASCVVRPPHTPISNGSNSDLSSSESSSTCSDITGHRLHTFPTRNEMFLQKAAKPLLHQDSTSSSDSSEAGMLPSAVVVDDGVVWYTRLQPERRSSEDLAWNAHENPECSERNEV